MHHYKIKFTNARLSKELNDVLSAHDLFQGDNYKLIAPCHYLLNKIHSDCVFKEREFVSLHHKYIQDKFRPYNANYRPIIEALRQLGLLEIKLNATGAETYFHSENKENSFCKQYRVTDKCAELLRLENKEYLRKLHNDPQIRKHIRRTKAQRLRRLNNTGDLVIDNIKTNLFQLRYEKEDADNKLDILAKTPDGKNTTKERARAARRVNNALHTLIDIKSGNFDVNMCDKDGRSHNTWTLMNSNLRQIFHIHRGNTILYPTHTIDIRAAHPTFLGLYLKKLYLKYYYYTIYNNNSSLLSSTFLYSHYANDIEASFKYDLLAEVEQWNDLWTNPAIDPRDTIAASLGITKQNVKDLLNSAINDAYNKNKLHLWIEKNFPFIYSVWIRTKINETGINISKHYETRIIRDNEFQAFVNSIPDVKVMDEHDGLSIFTDLNDTEAENKVKSIKEFLVNSCCDKFGIKPVIKVKYLKQLN